MPIYTNNILFDQMKYRGNERGRENLIFWHTSSSSKGRCPCASLSCKQKRVSDLLGPKQHQHYHHSIGSFCLKHVMKLGCNSLKEVASRSHSSDGQTPSFNKHWRFIHHQPISAIMLGGWSVLQFFHSSLFFYYFLSFIYTGFLCLLLNKLSLKNSIWIMVII